MKGKEWRTHFPLMMQTLMIKAFEDSGKVRGVGRSTEGLKIDRLLITEVSNCEFDLCESRKTAVVNIRLTAKIMVMPERKIIATQTFHETAASPVQTFPSMLTALENAAGKLLSKLTAWVLEQKE